MKHFDFAFPNMKSKAKNTFIAVNYCLFYLAIFTALLLFFVFVEPIGGMTDYEFIYKLCIFFGTLLIDIIVLFVWVVRIVRSKRIGVNLYEDKLEIFRYCPMGLSAKLKLTIAIQSIESVVITTVTKEIQKQAQSQHFLPIGSECILIETINKAAFVFSTKDNETLAKQISKKITPDNSGE